MIVGDDIKSITHANLIYLPCCYILSYHIENMFHSHLHHPWQMPISESRNVRSIRSLTFHLAKRKMNNSKMWQLRPTKDRMHLGSLLASKITSIRKVQPISKKHISYIHLLTSCSNLTQLSSSSPILKTICVSTRYHSSAYSTSISHLVSFYSILNQSFSSLLSSKHTIFP